MQEWARTNIMKRITFVMMNMKMQMTAPISLMWTGFLLLKILVKKNYLTGVVPRLCLVNLHVCCHVAFFLNEKRFQPKQTSKWGFLNVKYQNGILGIEDFKTKYFMLYLSNKVGFVGCFGEKHIYLNLKSCVQICWMIFFCCAFSIFCCELK
jgi:hypothetical protein